MKRKNLNLLFVVALIATMLVGCGDTTKTGVVNEIGAVENQMTEKVDTMDVSDEANEISSEATEVDETETEVIPTEPESETTSSESTEESILESTEEAESIPESTEETEPATPSHEHSYTTTVIGEDTCTSYAVKTFTCSCGHSYEKIINDLICQRDYNFVTIKEPTCHSSGEKVDHCIYCGGQTVLELIPMTEHVPTIRVDVPESGKWFIPCEYCGTTLDWGYLE